MKNKRVLLLPPPPPIIIKSICKNTVHTNFKYYADLFARNLAISDETEKKNRERANC
jgi:hypothetical protein